MPTQLNPNKALARAQRLCSQSEKCTFEIIQKLRLWGIYDHNCQTIIDSLINDGFIDESRYALAFAREKARLNKWGPKKIELALKAKQIQSQCISSVLSEIEQMASKDSVYEILSKKIKTIKFKDKFDLKGKLVRYGVSRGFDYEQVVEVVEAIISK